MAAIEPSEGLMCLEAFFKGLEKRSVEFSPIDKPVYARPLTCEQCDMLAGKTGHAYNVRLIQAALVYEDGTPVFKETDIFRMMKSDPGVIGRTAMQISALIVTSFDQIKN
ncbi:MAG TPA: hypothetical protein PKI68_01040 [Pontiellaceae bacterium]|nr:hypothetical protein [Pontiellaceae bacterium]